MLISTFIFILETKRRLIIMNLRLKKSNNKSDFHLMEAVKPNGKRIMTISIQPIEDNSAIITFFQIEKMKYLGKGYEEEFINMIIPLLKAEKIEKLYLYTNIDFETTDEKIIDPAYINIILSRIGFLDCKDSSYKCLNLK